MVEGGTTRWSWKCPYCGSVFIWLWYRDLSLNIFQQNIFSSKLLQHNLGSIFPSTIFFILDTNYYWPPRQPRWGKRNKYYFSLLWMSSRVVRGCNRKVLSLRVCLASEEVSGGRLMFFDSCWWILTPEHWWRLTSGHCSPLISGSVHKRRRQEMVSAGWVNMTWYDDALSLMNEKKIFK